MSRGSASRVAPVPGCHAVRATVVMIRIVRTASSCDTASNALAFFRLDFETRVSEWGVSTFDWCGSTTRA